MTQRKPYLRTSDLAKAAGIHPNTVRRYVDWGLLPPVERSPAGYRRFTQAHLDCLLLARRVLSGDYYPGKVIRASGKQIIQAAVDGDWGAALEQARRHLALVQAEQAQAEAAAALLEGWAAAGPETLARGAVEPLQIGPAARLLGVSSDILRNWERNGLIRVPRAAANGYRCYGAPEIGRLRVIRLLSRAGYSLMAILRMLGELDAGRTGSLRQALDTPRPDEDVYMASDRWLSTLAAQAALARQVIQMIEAILAREK